MLYQNPTIAFIDKPLIKYRVHKDSLSNEIGKLNLGEIQSEIKAREKHIAILEKNTLVDPRILKLYVKSRYQYFLRETLVKKLKCKWYFLKNLLKYQMQLKDGKGIVKTLFGFVFYCVFNKGYKYL